MLLGVPSEAHLTSAKETFLLDCKAAGLNLKTMRSYSDVLTGFINFAGDMLVRELGPDHVRTYIAELTDRAGHYEGEKFSSRSLMKHYAVIRTWIRWIYAQRLVTERESNFKKAPGWTGSLLLFLTGSFGCRNVAAVLRP
jgi:site-specific recombinase XerD